LHLEVSAAGAARPTVSRAPSDVARATPDARLAFLRVSIGKKKVYVGEAVPITLKAYFRPGTEVTLAGAPSLGSTAFTVSQLPDQPHQSVETIGGEPYRVASWSGTVSAAMSGHFSSVSTLPIVVRYREETPSANPFGSNPFGSMFGDDDSFPDISTLRSMMQRSTLGGGDIGDLFGRVRQRDMTLRAPEQTLDVLPLPANGRPAEFTGAVGHFDVGATLTPSSGSAFEPMSLKLEVTGRGNFDRVSSTGLPSSDTWKTYPMAAIPEKGAANAPVVSKTFEQAVVPQKDGVVALPPISFAFFDPDRARYVVRTTPAITARIAPAAGGSVASAAPSPASDASAASPAPIVAQPMKIAEGHYVSAFTVPYRQAWFWALQLALALCAAGAIAWQTRSARGPSARARRRAYFVSLAERKEEMKRAAVMGDDRHFFDAARAALQLRLADHWGIEPDDVTVDEVTRRCGESGATLLAALDAADRARYSGVSAPRASLTKWNDLILRELDQVELRP
jgi:hypothetical protein